MYNLKSQRTLLLPLFASVLFACQSPQTTVEKQVDDLLSKMTLEEKVGQMAQITLDVLGEGKDRFSSDIPFKLDSAAVKKALIDYKIGSVLNTTNNIPFTAKEWNNLINTLQNTVIKGTPLAIPLIYGLDQIHGTTYTYDGTMFPQEITLAASFDPINAYNMASVCAYETRASGVPWNFSPVLDLGNDPRFGRIFEGFGEDPYLISQMGVAMVKGYEGIDGNIANPEKLAACAKHFCGYTSPITGKDRTPAFIPDNVLKEYHIEPFRKAIEQGVHTIMINSGIINGETVHASYKMLTEILRNELGFKGVIVTDWADIINIYRRDRIAADNKEAVMMAINAGIDMSMIPYAYESFCDDLIALVKEGKVKQSRIDDAVRRILTLKVELGLFKTPTTFVEDYPKFGSEEFAKLSYQGAAEGITLLKNNNNILPLPKEAKILVCGPNANTMRPLNGAWSYSWQGELTDKYTPQFKTIYKAIASQWANTQYLSGVSYKMDGKYYEESEDNIAAVVSAARKAQYIVICVGENSSTEKPGDLNDLYLSDTQQKLVIEVAKTGKPIILVISGGRPRCISKIEPLTAAVIHTYCPGNFGGDALADILMGTVNPSGKLPYNYPRYPNSLVNYYHKPAEEQTAIGGVYNYESDYNPQWEFGYGLSYTTFTYNNLKLSSSILTDQTPITVSIEVTNTGSRIGKEAVLLFSSDLIASITPDMKRLRKFDKITLNPGEKQTVTFELTTQDLSFVNNKNQWVCENGEFELMIADKKCKIEKQ